MDREKDEGSAVVLSSKVIAIGASAGGPGILLGILRQLPAAVPGIVVVQHLSQGFTARLSEFLNSQCRMKVKEAANLEPVCNGTVYIASGGTHLSIMKGGQGYYLKCGGSDLRNGVCPSADVLFSSAACAGKNGMGIILSGMGRDGADGLFKLYQAGALTIGQDQASSPVYGMPYEAKKAGAVRIECTPEQIVDQILSFSGRED